MAQCSPAVHKVVSFVSSVLTPVTGHRSRVPRSTGGRVVLRAWPRAPARARGRAAPPAVAPVDVRVDRGSRTSQHCTLSVLLYEGCAARRVCIVSKVRSAAEERAAPTRCVCARTGSGTSCTFSVWGPLYSYLNGGLYEELYEGLRNKVLSLVVARTGSGTSWRMERPPRRFSRTYAPKGVRLSLVQPLSHTKFD